MEGERGDEQVRLVFEQHGFLDQSESEAAIAPTPTRARIALETGLRGEVKGHGLLAPEARIDPEPYVRHVVRETGMLLREREEIIRTAHFAEG